MSVPIRVRIKLFLFVVPEPTDSCKNEHSKYPFFTSAESNFSKFMYSPLLLGVAAPYGLVLLYAALYAIKVSEILNEASAFPSIMSEKLTSRPIKLFVNCWYNPGDFE